MNRGLSLYFDLLRTVAAFEVFLFHMHRFRRIGLAVAWWNFLGYEAVILFFVLSGFVIGFAASERDVTLDRYIVSRLTRILSVAVPAVLLTYIADQIGHRVDPTIYSPFPLDVPLIRLAAGLTMLNESWVSIQMFSNWPLWSVAYEFWYYFLFAAAFFLRGRLRLVTIFILAIIAGPHSLLLFPIWLLGQWAYRERWSARLPRVAIVLLALVPLAGIWLYFAESWRQHGVDALLSVMSRHTWRYGLSASRYVLSDTALGALIALHFIGMRGLGPKLEQVLSTVARPVRFAAAYSFTLYALHQPLMLLFASILGAAGLPVSPWTVGGLTLAMVYAVGTVTERQRDRLKPLFARALAAVLPARVLASAGAGARAI